MLSAFVAWRTSTRGQVWMLHARLWLTVVLSVVSISWVHRITLMKLDQIRPVRNRSAKWWTLDN